MKLGLVCALLTLLLSALLVGCSAPPKELAHVSAGLANAQPVKNQPSPKVDAKSRPAVTTTNETAMVKKLQEIIANSLKNHYNQPRGVKGDDSFRFVFMHLGLFTEEPPFGPILARVNDEAVGIGIEIPLYVPDDREFDWPTMVMEDPYAQDRTKRDIIRVARVILTDIDTELGDQLAGKKAQIDMVFVARHHSTPEEKGEVLQGWKAQYAGDISTTNWSSMTNEKFENKLTFLID